MNKRAYAVFYMFCLTLVFTSLVTVAKVVNEERIAVNQQAKLQRVILTVLNIPQALSASRKRSPGFLPRILLKARPAAELSTVPMIRKARSYEAMPFP